MKHILLILVFLIDLMACPPPYSNVNMCELMPEASKDAQAIWESTKNSEAAIEKLQQAGLVQIMYASRKKLVRECADVDPEAIVTQYRIYLLDVIAKKGMSGEYRSELKRMNQIFPSKDTLEAQIYSGETSPFDKESFIRAYNTYTKLLEKEGEKPKITPDLKANLIAFGLIPAENRWAKLLGSAADAPTKGFTRISFNVDNPSEIYDKRMTPYITYNNMSPNETVFWSGRIDLEEETTLTLKMPPTKATYRVIIDGYVAVKVDSYIVTDMIPFQQKLSKGTHTIEVELSTSSHSDFALTIVPEMKRVHGSEFNNKLREIGAEGAEVWLASIYSAQTIDGKMLVKLKPSKKPVVLLLGSYSAVNWVVDAGNTDLRAVFYTGMMSPGTVVSANEKKFPVYLSGQLPSRSLELGASTPQCINGIYSFAPYRSIMSSIDHLNKSYGITLRALGYPSQSYADTITIPSHVLDDAEYLRMRKFTEEEERESKKCVRNW